MFSLLNLNCPTKIGILFIIFLLIIVIIVIIYRKKVKNYKNISESLNETNNKERDKREVLRASTLRIDEIHEREFGQNRRNQRGNIIREAPPVQDVVV